MKPHSSLAVLAALVMAAGCGKALAPETGAGTDYSLARGTVRGAANPTFSVQLKITGSIVTLDPDGTPQVRQQAFYVTGPKSAGAPLDTVPAYGVLKQVLWRPSPSFRGAAASPAAVGPSTLPAEGETGTVFAPGFHDLVLTAPDYAGGGEVHVTFWCGFTPGTWWAGPDPSLWPAASDGDGHAVDVSNWSTLATTPAWPPDGRTYFAPDSFASIPSIRRPPGGDLERRTFYEIFGDRVYARSEGDLVHQNSWIVVVNGGYDKDSPYTPKVVASDPGLPSDFGSDPSHYPVLQSLGLVGSPIGFRWQLTTVLSDGTRFRTPTSLMYPVFDPTSPFRQPQVAGYTRAALAGTAYLVVRAEDSDGLRDGAVDDPVALVALVDGGGGTPADRIARRKVLTFRVAPAAAPMARAVGAPAR